MHPLRWATASRLRLFFAIAVTAGLVFLAGRLAADYIRHYSTSTAADLLLITGVMFLLLAASAFEAVLVGDLLFQRRWRETLLPAGEAPEPEPEDIPDDQEPAPIPSGRFSSSVVRFSLLVLAFVSINGIALEAVTGGFMEYYRSFGYFSTVLRGGDLEARSKALLDMADAPTSVLSDYTLKFISPLSESPQDETRMAALDALAVVGRRMNRSVDLLNQAAASSDQWEYRLAIALRERVAPRLRERLAIAHGNERARITETLGSFRDIASIPAITDQIWRGEAPAPALVEAAVLALGEMRDMQAVPPLLDAVREKRADERVVGLAIYGIGDILSRWQPGRMDRAPPPITGEAVETLSRMLPELTGTNQCVAVDAFRKMRDGRAAPALFRLFESEASTFICPDLEVPRRRMAPLVLSERERVRLWTLRALAQVALGNEEVQEWLAAQMERKERYPEDIIRELRNVYALSQQAGP